MNDIMFRAEHYWTCPRFLFKKGMLETSVIDNVAYGPGARGDAAAKELYHSGLRINAVGDMAGHFKPRNPKYPRF